MVHIEHPLELRLCSLGAQPSPPSFYNPHVLTGVAVHCTHHTLVNLDMKASPAMHFGHQMG
jgi:hypothetical protein